MTSETMSPAYERRVQARLPVQLPVQIQCEGEDQPRRAMLLDLSWGGALCQTRSALPVQQQQLVYLYLPWEENDRIQIEAQLLRKKVIGIGQYLVALRFRRLSLSNHNRLERLLGKLIHQDPLHRELKTKPLVATLEVPIRTIEDWRTALTQIAKGRLIISTPLSFMPGQSIGLRFNGVPRQARLNLRARVLHSEPRPNPDGTTVYRLTLMFEHPDDALLNWTQWLLSQIPANATGPLPADSKDLSPAPEAIPAKLVTIEDTRSALELGFPEATNYLITAWGDPESFDIVFRQLIFGETGTTESWTPEAWEELQFLQTLHEQTYGVSEGRQTMLKIVGQEPF